VAARAEGGPDQVRTCPTKWVDHRHAGARRLASVRAGDAHRAQPRVCPAAVGGSRVAICQVVRAAAGVSSGTASASPFAARRVFSLRNTVAGRLTGQPKQRIDSAVIAAYVLRHRCHGTLGLPWSKRAKNGQKAWIASGQSALWGRTALRSAPTLRLRNVRGYSACSIAE
jgi:hypothetical protein